MSVILNNLVLDTRIIDLSHFTNLSILNCEYKKSRFEKATFCLTFDLEYNNVNQYPHNQGHLNYYLQTVLLH